MDVDPYFCRELYCRWIFLSLGLGTVDEYFPISKELKMNIPLLSREPCKIIAHLQGTEDEYPFLSRGPWMSIPHLPGSENEYTPSSPGGGG